MKNKIKALIKSKGKKVCLLMTKLKVFYNGNFTNKVRLKKISL